jgi:hypothetical protein
MADAIRYNETTDVAGTRSGVRDAVSLRFDPSRRVMLRFQVMIEADDDLEALRYARRSMIREERTRGLEWDEPSMEDPTLAGSELRWFALASQVAWCRQKMDDLIARANRAAEEMRRTRR